MEFMYAIKLDLLPVLAEDVRKGRLIDVRVS